jgi:hypothetical protein
MQNRFDSIEKKLDTKADKTQVDRIINTLDGVIGELRDFKQEQQIINHRYHNWIGQLADNTKTKLVPEQ